MKDLNLQSIDDIVKAVSVKEAALSGLDMNKLNELSFELFKETAGLLVLCSHLYEGEPALERNQAICTGLLVRTAKFMTAIMCLSVDRLWHRDATMALSRSVLESIANLRFLILADDGAQFDGYVKAGLAPEKELYDVITSTIQTRGGSLPIEDRMLKSIENIFHKSNLRVEEVDKKFRSWGGSLKDRLNAIDEEEMYLFIQRLPSHAVHGSWVDLLFHHLEYKGGSFVPNPDEKPVDARIFDPVSIYVLKGAKAYIEKFYGGNPQLEPLLARIIDLSERIVKVDGAHEKLLQKRGDEHRPTK